MSLERLTPSFKGLVVRGGRYLVATEVPEGIIVHTELGVSQDTTGPRLGEYQKRGISGAENLHVVRASEVGLEWRDSSGQKPEESNKWADKFYVWVSGSAKKLQQ